MKLQKVDVGVDRLSELPDQVIVHILSLMSTQDAVRTMLLRRFGNLWTMLPALKFDFSDHPDVDVDVAYREKQRITIEAFSRFARFVRNVLMFHRRSTIDSFYLDIGDCIITSLVDPCLIDDLQVWLKFAIDREVKALHFGCDFDDKIIPPRCVFTSQSLVTLTLWDCELVQYEHQPPIQMGALRKLSLLSAHGSNEAFNQLISACPSLQELELINSQGLRDLNITAPTARRLDLDIDVTDNPFTLNCPHVEILKIAVDGECSTSQSVPLNVINVSSLEEVHVRELPRMSSSIIKAFLSHFRDAEAFALSIPAFKQLCCLENVEVPQNRWQRLALRPWWDNERCVHVIIELVKSSVELEELIVDDGLSRSEVYNEVLNSELSTYVMPHLKYVTIRGYGNCCEGQFQLIEVILRNAVVLEILEITFEENRLTLAEELEFVKQVSRLKRASVNAIVDFA